MLLTFVRHAVERIADRAAPRAIRAMAPILKPRYCGTLWVVLVVSLICQARVASVRAEEESEWDRNLVVNPSFESGKKPWETRVAARLSNMARSAGKYVYATVMLDNSVAHSGHTSLSIQSDASTSMWHAAESEPIAIEPGKQYRVSAWMKTRDVQQEGEQYYNSNLYVRFITTADEEVRIGKLRLRATERLLGTNDWTYVHQVVTAPEGADLAYVGCVMTCTGKAWFDDVALQQHAEIPWKTRETDRFMLYYEGSDAPTDDQIADLESHLKKMEKELGYTYPRKIQYFKFADVERKKAITGNAANAHFEGNAVYADSWGDRHEIVHVVASVLGHSVIFLEEGLAVHLAGPWAGHDLHSYARLLAEKDLLLPVGQLLDDKAFRTFPAEDTYPEAGSFVRYVVDIFGMDRFKKLYPVTDDDSAMATISARFQELYGLSIGDAEKAWLTFLVPAETNPGEIKPGLFQVDPSKLDEP